LSAEVFDEIAATTGDRNENAYSGVRGFFMSFSFAVRTLIIVSIQKLTGFNENLDFQSDMAILGLRISMSIVPLICIIIAFILIKKFYTITPEKLNYYKLKLDKLGI
jgi:Na+/melibiose symporter-like transporter